MGNVLIKLGPIIYYLCLAFVSFILHVPRRIWKWYLWSIYCQSKWIAIKQREALCVCFLALLSILYSNQFTIHDGIEV